ncbi:hypothetical protein JGY91_13235 [Staphylococcus xylosus]|uniref:hypothetical protein n=1 Tax=Staphylococcus xylosus TaxID=1288 RepID=UPI001931BE94|nr:hypothetical protein [Staphylococcus xylosus]
MLKLYYKFNFATEPTLLSKMFSLTLFFDEEKPLALITLVLIDVNITKIHNK